jgi:hypothetical protein
MRRHANGLNCVDPGRSGELLQLAASGNAKTSRKALDAAESRKMQEGASQNK